MNEVRALTQPRAMLLTGINNKHPTVHYLSKMGTTFVSLFKPPGGGMQGKHRSLITDANPGDAFDSKAFPLHACFSVAARREADFFLWAETICFCVKAEIKSDSSVAACAVRLVFQHPHLREVPGMN